MPEKKSSPSKVTLKVKWGMEESQFIFKANAFRTVYSPGNITLSIGLLDPEYLLPERTQGGKEVSVKTIARYQLDTDDLKRLKAEIEKTIAGLKKSGAWEDE